MAIHNFNCILDPRLDSRGVKTCFVIVLHGRIKNSYPANTHSARQLAISPAVPGKISILK